MTRKFLLATIFPIGCLMCGCLGIGPRFEATEVIDRTFAPKGTPTVIVDTFNGSIDVVAAEESSVSAQITRRASGTSPEDAKASMDTVEVQASQEGNTIRIQAKTKENQLFSNRGANVAVQVPSGTILDLRTSNGKVEVTGLMGDVKAQSSNGKMTVKGTRGTVRLVTSNGAIELDGGVGPVHLESSNGSIHIRSDKALVDAHTSNGSIHFTTNKLAEGNHHLGTSNGTIEVALPADAQFRVDATTSHGKITSDFPVQGGKAKPKSQLHGTVGSNPTVTLELTTSNGAIKIRKAS